ncbi:MAG: HlyD family efflux transporter periplasmic adaptor subunit [Planctomycetota bacterium]
MSVSKQPDPDWPSVPSLPRRIRVPLRVRLADLWRGPGQFALWALVGVTGFWIASAPPLAPAAVGVVRSTELAVSFERPGRVQDLLVGSGSTVSAGTIVARLESASLDARVAVAQQEVAVVLADVAALSATHALQIAERELTRTRGAREAALEVSANRSRVRDEVWRLEIEERERRLAIDAIEVEIETDLLTAEQIRVQAGRFDMLVGDGFARQADVQDRQLAEQTLLGRVEANQRLIEATRAEVDVAAASLASAREILEGLGAPPSNVAARRDVETAAHEAALAAIDALQSRVDARRLEVSVLRSEREALILRAPIDGRIASVNAYPGQPIVAGASVVVIQAMLPRDVAVYLPEPTSGELETPQTILLSRLSAPEVAVEAEVLGLGRGVEQLPVRLWPSPNLPQFGRVLLVRPPDELGLIPGEVVGATIPPGA